MKIFFTLSFTIFISAFIIAQPTITSNVLPVKGDTILMSLDPTLVPAGANGANVTWDFSTSLHQDILVERIYLDPTNTAYSSKFPNAKLCRTDGIGAVYSYWDNSNNSKSVYYGFVEPNVYDQNYNNLPLSYYKFPINYNDAFVDSLSAITNPGGIVGPGKYYFNADGWGTLKLPHKTVSNVLRTKSVIYIGDSSPSINSYSITTEYAWYQPSKKEPLLVISSVIINHALHRKFVIYDNGSSTGINETALSEMIKLFPNPVSDILTICIDETHIKKECVISIFDITCKMQKTFIVNKSNPLFQIDMSDLPKGIYFVNMLLGDKQLQQKIFKE
jgi:hypothetical protein